MPSPNHHHAKGVAVLFGGHQVGWICRDDADAVFDKIKDSMAISGGSAVNARITDVDTGCSNEGYIYGVANVKIMRRRKLGDKDQKYRITDLDQTITFGRYVGETLEDVEDASYVNWMVAQAIISPELAREWRNYRADDDADINGDEDDEDDEEEEKNRW